MSGDIVGNDLWPRRFADKDGEIDPMTRDEIRLAPHSGIQFVRYEFNLDNAPRLTRSFIEHEQAGASAGAKSRVELLPGWNDDDPEADPPFAVAGTDITYDISKLKAVEPFLNTWTPVPFLAVRPSRDAAGRERLGPTNWCRVLVSEAQDKGKGATHTVVFAFDTEIVKPAPNRPYVGPAPEDVKGEREFAFSSRFRDIAWFLSDCKTVPGSSRVINSQEWADRWIDDAFIKFRRAQKGGRELREDERSPLEHAARYVTFIQFLALAIKPAPVRLIDTYSADPALKPVNVDLVLDIGNSRTCGMLIETFPDQPGIDLGNSYILQLRDLSAPHRTYQEPFESDVQLSHAHFGDEFLSKASMRARAFFWPSLVRVGPEAARFREKAKGTEGTSGMSSPKRYLCDVEAVNQEWRFQPGDYGSGNQRPLIDAVARSFMNGRGDVLRQVAQEKRFYERLSPLAVRAEIEKPASRLTYSRSAFFTLMVAEILAQTLSLINNPEIRSRRQQKDTPRRLMRIILTMPTAMPVREQWLLRSRAQAAVKLVWDLMGWTENPPPGLPVPEILAAWDEASCAQLVYLYAEIAHKFGGGIKDFMGLMGKRRAYAEPGKEQRGPEQPSLRIASIDVGGGTTDLMITTYYVEKNYALVPVQNFREGFRIAGEDILREVIQRALVPPMTRALKAAGMSKAPEFITNRFGSDRADMAEQDKHLRREYVSRVMKPAALALLSIYEKSEAAGEAAPLQGSIKFGDLVALAKSVSMTDESRIAGYIDEEAANWGAQGFRMKDMEIPIDFEVLRHCVDLTLGEVFGNIAAAIHHFDCDVVLLSGRPTRLPATIDLFSNKLAIAPDRIVPLSHYPPGSWFPFGGSPRFPIGDPKTATVVGCMLCVLAERQITNFTLYTHRLAMQSTANYIGVMELNGKLRSENILFSNVAQGTAEASVQWFAPMPIGFRQLPSERWVATPMYKLKSIGAAGNGIKRPVTITLVRESPEELADYEDKKFVIEEAKKEELKVLEAADRDGGNVSRSFALVLDTIGNDQGYWLDNGILNVY